MPIRFIKLLVAASLVLAPMVLPCVAANMPSAAALDAVNLAGRQRMLSQRIVKNYTLLSLGVLSEAADQQWHLLENALNQLQGDPAHIATTSERLVEVMDEVTRLYTAVPK